MFKDSPAAQAFVEYLATPEAAEIWAEARRLLVAEQEASTRASTRTRSSETTAGALGEAEIFRFDLSDLQPAAFGGTVGQGLFKLFQDFLAEPAATSTGSRTQMEAAGGEGVRLAA